MSQGLLNQNNRFLALKMWPLAREPETYSLYKGKKNQKNGRHYRKSKNFENRKKNLS